MRPVEVAELVLLAVGLLLTAALLLQYYFRRGRRGITNKPCSSELPLSRPNPNPATVKQSRLLLLLLRLRSGRRRARVEPATVNSAEAPPASLPEEEDVARWRERWFGGPASRALYTIEEEEDDGEECSSTEDEERPSEPETPFYTPPASPHRLAAQSPEATARSS